MAVEIEVRQFTVTSGTGNIDFTGFSFQPKACWFSITTNAGHNADSATGDGMGRCIGMCDGSTQWAMYSGAEDAQATSDVGRRSTASGCFARYDEQSSQISLGKASFVSFLSNGVRVNRLTSFTGPSAPLVRIIAFGGTDVSVFGALTAPNTTINNTVTVTPGFEADLVLSAMIGNHVDIDGNTNNDDDSFSSGWAVNPDRQAANNQFCIGMSGRDGQVNGESNMSIHNNRCAVSRLDDTIDPGVEITAFGATTFTVTTRDEGAFTNTRVGFLALKLGGAVGQIFSVNQDMPTSTGNQSQAGTSFTPIFLLGLAIGDDRSFNGWGTETDAQNASVGIGMTDGTRDFAETHWNDDEAATTNCASRIRNTHFWSLDNQGGGLEQEATFTSFNSDGWTINFGTALTPVKRAVYLAIGNVSVSIPSITDVETDEDYDDKDINITIAGATFEAVKGTGKVEVGDNADYATANKIEQTTTSWADTAIDYTADLGAQSPGSKWVFVTNDTGNKNDPGFAVTVHRAQAFAMAASANIIASGESTTVQLIAPSGKNTGDFDVGRIQDDENPADTINITVDNYTEIEWCIKAVTNSNDTDYVFRVTKAGVVLGTYTITPTLKVPALLLPDEFLTKLHDPPTQLRM